jgi:hypothetical protein
VEVAGLGPAPLRADEKRTLIERLAQLQGRPVDLIDVQTTRGPIIGRILQEGTRLFWENPSLHADVLKRWWADPADWDTQDILSVNLIRAVQLCVSTWRRT